MESPYPIEPAEERVWPPESEESPRTWSPVVFYTGVGVTAVLTSLTVWSGIDTLNAKAQLPGTQADNDRVMAKANRTDAFLAAHPHPQPGDLVIKTRGSAGGNDYSGDPSISGNGRYVAFTTWATNLFHDRNGSSLDVLVKDMETGQLSLASVGNDDGGDAVLDQLLVRIQRDAGLAATITRIESRRPAMIDSSGDTKL